MLETEVTPRFGLNSASDADPISDPPFTTATKQSDDHVDVSATSRQILNIIFEYALNKFNDSKERLERHAPNFLVVIDKFVATNSRVEACLPAFPFKSANKVYKVLGILPDKAEELALGRLNAMCEKIQEVYAPGAKVTIISDGITYNDLLSISDRDTWAYGEALRKMAARLDLDHIGFSRIKDLVDHPSLPQTFTEITYVANCTNLRRLLLNRFGDDDLDINKEIADKPDTKLTYLGYKRFLESDLKHIFPRGPGRGVNAYQREVKFIAKQMLIRGHAFALAIKAAFPNHLRLSIHESVAGEKLSICLLNTKTGFTTPWHCSVAQLADGEWTSAPMGEYSQDSRLELVYANGRPSHFMEKPCEGTGQAVAGVATAKYLKEAKPRNVNEYLSKVAMPSAPSSAPKLREKRHTGPAVEVVVQEGCKVPEFKLGAIAAQ